MKHSVLKALLGKFISKNMGMAYSHVDQIIIMEEKPRQVIASVYVKSYVGCLYHWFIEATWDTDKYGTHTISKVNILKEDEIGGRISEEDETVQRTSERLQSESSVHESMQVPRRAGVTNRRFGTDG